MKKRVRCVNCGMIYDICVSTWNEEDNLHGICPKCKSNAFEEYTKEEWEKG